VRVRVEVDASDPVGEVLELGLQGSHVVSCVAVNRNACGVRDRLRMLRPRQPAQHPLTSKQVAGKSQYTLRNYRTSFTKLARFLDADPAFSEITRERLIGCFIWLQEE
jgi:hypothetical protein